ncbi:MAG: hypothetical protein ACI4MC_02920 [Candidatus Coproplasma sp.]
MNKTLKHLIGVICGATLAICSVAFSACNGSGDGASYNGIGTEYIVSHTEGQKVKYTFEAENTNLNNKSGPGASGTFNGESMVIPGDSSVSNGYCVDGMAAKGVSLNFVIVSDRNVKDATLILRLGSEYNFTYTFDAEMFQVRIDPVSELDVLPYDAEESGAWGNWDDDFLGVYNDDILPFAGYYIEEYDCGEISVEATSMDPSGFEDFTVSVKLSLQAGLNCISLITNNNVSPAGQDNATMTSTAPLVDCIKIITDAQLGLYNPQNNLKIGTDKACTYSAA